MGSSTTAAARVLNRERCEAVGATPHVNVGSNSSVRQRCHETHSEHRHALLICHAQLGSRRGYALVKCTRVYVCERVYVRERV